MKARCTRVVWCAVGPEEQSKCQQWSEQSGQNVTCATASTTDDCIALVLVGACARPASGAGGGPRSPHLVGGEQGLSGACLQGAGSARACAEWGQSFLSCRVSVVDFALF